MGMDLSDKVPLRQFQILRNTVCAIIYLSAAAIVKILPDDIRHAILEIMPHIVVCLKDPGSDVRQAAIEALLGLAQHGA